MRGKTLEERAQARADRALDRVAATCVDRMRTAATPQARVSVACGYAQAVAKRVTDERAAALARDLAAVVDGVRRP